MSAKASVNVFRAPDAWTPPPDRGRLWYDFEIPDAFFKGLPGISQKVRWVREHFPKETRIKIGQKSAWYEHDILDYVESRRTAV